MKNFCFALVITLVIYKNNAYGSEAGMPQLNPEFWASQIFWLLLTFSVLYIIIWKIFLPKITYSIESRKSKIVNDLDETQKIKESAEKKLIDYNIIIEKSKKDAKKLIEDSKKKLDRDIEDKRKKFNDEIEKEIEATEIEIKKLKTNSLSNIATIAVEISEEVMRQVINTEINKSNVSAVVNDIAKKEMEKGI